MQILGKKGHTLSWLTGISNPYIRVSLIGTNTDCEAGPSLSSKILNLPSNASCKLEGVGDENLKDCLLKFVVLDFDRFSRSEFVAEVLVTLGDLEDLNEGVIICEELKLQQKVTVRKGKERSARPFSNCIYTWTCVAKMSALGRRKLQQVCWHLEANCCNKLI